MNTEAQVQKVMRVIGLENEEEIRAALEVPKPKTVENLSDTKRLQLATTVNECLEICAKIASRQSNISKQAIEKALLLVTTPKECVSILTIVTLYGFEADRRACDSKMEILLKPQFEAAISVADYLEVCEYAPRRSETRIWAIQKAMDLASTLKEYLDIFGQTIIGSAAHHTCIRKISELLADQPITA